MILYWSKCYVYFLDESFTRVYVNGCSAVFPNKQLLSWNMRQ